MHMNETPLQATGVIKPVGIPTDAELVMFVQSSDIGSSYDILKNREHLLTGKPRAK